MSYKEFVKATYHKLPADLSAKEKIKKIAELWRSKKGVHKTKGGEVAGGAVAGGAISEVMDTVGLGVHKQKKVRARKSKGGAVAGGEVAGGEVVGGEVAGGDVSDKVKMKHYKKMIALEQKLHKDGKLSPSQHDKLKVYHHLHGGNFFDSILSGVKKGTKFIADNKDIIKMVVPELAKLAPDNVKSIIPMLPGLL